MGKAAMELLGDREQNRSQMRNQEVRSSTAVHELKEGSEVDVWMS
jgi:hypothetical protein